MQIKADPHPIFQNHHSKQRIHARYDSKKSNKSPNLIQNKQLNNTRQGDNIALSKQVRLASIGKRSAGREDPEPHPPSAIGEAKPMPEPSQADENFSLSCSKWQIHANHDSNKSKKESNLIQNKGLDNAH